MNNYFHIRNPYYSAWKKYGWSKDDWGIGLAKYKIDELAKKDKTIVVRYGKKLQNYTISAKKVQKYPIEIVKNYNLQLYVIPKSALNYRKKKSEEDEMKELSKLGVFG